MDAPRIETVASSRVLDWPTPPQVYLVTAHHSQDCKIMQASFWHCKLKQLERSRMFAKDLDDRLTAHGSLSGPHFNSGNNSGNSSRLWWPSRPSWQLSQRRRSIRTGSMRMTSTSKNSLMTRRKPSSSGRMTSPPLQSMTASNTSKGRPRWHCRMQDVWWEKKADEIETYAVTKNSKMFFSATKKVYSPTKPRTMPLLSAESSTPLKEKSSIDARWREHFSI